MFASSLLFTDDYSYKVSTLKTGLNPSDTYSLRHCDLVQLHGFLGLEVVSAADKL